MAAIAWSWAALVHLRLDPAVVFHQEGYRGGSQSLIENFSMGRFVGVPMLRWMGMITRQHHFRRCPDGYANEIGMVRTVRS